MRTFSASVMAFAALLSCLLLQPATLAAEDEPAQPESEILVKVSKIRNANGQLGCSLYSKPDGFPMNSEKAYRSVWVKIKSGKALCTFKGVKPGTYAVAVVHDEDKSGKINTKSFGRPAEGWGVSNNAPAEKFGPPKYEKAKFKYDGGEKPLSIGLTYP